MELENNEYPIEEYHPDNSNWVYPYYAGVSQYVGENNNPGEEETYPAQSYCNISGSNETFATVNMTPTTPFSSKTLAFTLSIDARDFKDATDYYNDGDISIENVKFLVNIQEPTEGFLKYIYSIHHDSDGVVIASHDYAARERLIQYGIVRIYKHPSSATGSQDHVSFVQKRAELLYIGNLNSDGSADISIPRIYLKSNEKISISYMLYLGNTKLMFMNLLAEDCADCNKVFFRHTISGKVTICRRLTIEREETEDN